MSKSNRYTEEFKIEAVKQVAERNYPVAEVAELHRELAIKALLMAVWRRQSK